tara:strand:+ start:132 stop:266 length:135 start_codon:yes stop_codon:yes gene_type:complete
MKAKQMLSLTNMLEKIISDMDDLKQMINDLKMEEVKQSGFMEEE